MSEKIVQFNEEIIKGQIKELVRGSVPVVAQCVYYFNYIRPVRKLNGKPPALFRTGLVA